MGATQMFQSNILDMFDSSYVIGLFIVFLLLVIKLIIIKENYGQKVFLVDFACYKPPSFQKCSNEKIMERATLYSNLSERTLEFMRKTLERTGLGPSTYLPEALLTDPPNPCLSEARKEAEAVIFGVVDELLVKTGVRCEDIGILVVNCSIFNTIPSLSEMIMNKYKLKDNVICYNLQGMGCSAGLSSIALAQRLLQVHANSCALVVSTEGITENCYFGHNRAMILINCLFRVGGAAILLSNRQSDRHSAKYQLIHTVQTNSASSDRSYNCIMQEEDRDGLVGVAISKDLIAVATKTIEANITTLGRLILPTSEKLLYAANYLIRYLGLANIKPYVPDFKKPIDHVFAHVGGKPVLDELERNLELSEVHMEASRMTLYRFGNTSSSSIWYELAYAEAKGRMRRGDCAWQIAFGSGFKCNSVIWKALKNIQREKCNPWFDEIDQFPVDLSKIGAFTFYFEPSKNVEV